MRVAALVIRHFGRPAYLKTMSKAFDLHPDAGSQGWGVEGDYFSAHSRLARLRGAGRLLATADCEDLGGDPAQTLRATA